MYNRETIYIVGDAKSPENNPIMKQYHAFFVAFVIHRVSGEIVDAECSATVSVTRNFVSSLLIGKNILEDEALEEIQDRYFGSSQKALMVAFKDARKKYQAIQAKRGGRVVP